MTRRPAGPRPRWPSRVRTGDHGTMAMLLMVAVVGLMLSALLVPMIITQDRTTRFDITRVHALDAAQAGTNITLGVIRTAVTSGIGDSGKLPCGPFGGRVNGSGSDNYSVTVEYFTFDPVSEPDTTDRGMKCVPGYGTYDTATGVVTPIYARLTSTGSDGAAVNGSSRGRTLVTTYVLRTSNTNVPGGVIKITPPNGGSDYCMDVGTGTPVTGTAVVLQACSTSNPPGPRQVFTYRNDLTLQLRTSITSTSPGLCIDTAAPPAAGGTVKLGACVAAGSTPPYTQQWSINDHGAFEAALSTSTGDGVLSGKCMNVSSQAAGVPVLLAACDNDTDSTAQAWNPDRTVGAGAAASPQLVNFFEFGRCLDVTATNVSTDHLQAYPCKQNPSAGAVKWNQKFTLPSIATNQTSASGRVYTTTGGHNYCLLSPGATGAYVTLQVCDTGSSPLWNWTVSNGDAALPYSARYTIASGSLCLGLTDAPAGYSWSAADVEPCSGSADQKWNAAPNLATPALKNTREK